MDEDGEETHEFTLKCDTCGDEASHQVAPQQKWRDRVLRIQGTGIDELLRSCRAVNPVNGDWRRVPQAYERAKDILISIGSSEPPADGFPVLVRAGGTDAVASAVLQLPWATPLVIRYDAGAAEATHATVASEHRDFWSYLVVSRFDWNDALIESLLRYSGLVESGKLIFQLHRYEHFTLTQGNNYLHGGPRLSALPQTPFAIVECPRLGWLEFDLQEDKSAPDEHGEPLDWGAVRRSLGETHGVVLADLISCSLERASTNSIEEGPLRVELMRGGWIRDCASKSARMKRVLSLYPQIILHNHYQGRNFTAVQIVWLRLECPKDGSVTALCTDFFKAVDDLIDTNYSERYGRKGRNTQELMLFMAVVAAEHHLGVLVIDEIQDLSTSKSGGAAQVLNFFVKLINTIGIPVVLIGTYKAIPMMCSEFRLARRGSGQGDLVWDRMSYSGEDEEWELFVETLWELQYVKKACALTPALSKTLYDVSYGITDLAIRIYMASQVRAIETGREEITGYLLRSAYRDDFRLVNHILETLKSGNISPLLNLSDVYPPAIQDIHSSTTEDGASDGQNDTSRSNNTGSSVKSGKNSQQPPTSTTRAQHASGRDKLVTPSFKSAKRPKKAETVYDKDDLRGVITVQKKLDPTVSAYDVLLKEGYINPAMEYMQGDI